MANEAPSTPAPLSPFAAHVIEWMDEREISGREMARRCDLSPSYFTTLRSGRTEVPSPRIINAISKVIGFSLWHLVEQPEVGDISLIDTSKDTAIEDIDPKFRRSDTPKNAAIAHEAPMEVTAAQLYLPLDVPVLGVSMGGDGHDFRFNGETVDYVRRPLGIAKARKAYATFVIGESMVPAHKEGSLLFVNPDRPPSIGDDVVIELHPEHDIGEPGPGYIKRLKKRTPTKIIVEQFNPPKDIEFDLEDVKSMHRVVPWNELLGI